MLKHMVMYFNKRTLDLSKMDNGLDNSLKYLNLNPEET